MMPRRRSELLADLSQCPTVDASALIELRRARFDQLSQAINHYVDGQPLTRIEEQTGVGRRQLYRSLDRCLDTHVDGRVWGWPVLSPQVRTTQYQRTKKSILAYDGQTGLTGAFGQIVVRTKWSAQCQLYSHNGVIFNFLYVTRPCFSGSGVTRLQGIG